MLIETFHRIPRKEVLVEIRNVRWISYDESTVFAILTTAPIAPSPAAGRAPVGAEH